MTEILFKEVHYSLGGRIRLPDTKRSFAWANAKIPGRVDSMYRSYLKLAGATA